MHKIFSKVLVNKLKKILPQIITKHQSAFTKNRNISDNILVAFETLRSMQNHKSVKEGFMALKIDMSKAWQRRMVLFGSCNEEDGVQQSMDFFVDALC